MPAPDTSLGGAHAQFPPTAWSLISRLGATGTRDHRVALEDLCSRYWKPVYRFLRIEWAKSNEDAKDLTQAFFVWLMEEEPLEKYARERGGFRAFLKVLLRRFASNQKRALDAVKRGGDVKLVPIDAATVENDAAGAGPEEAFDRAWMAEVLKTAMDRLRKKFVAAGKEKLFLIFEEYDLSESRASYGELAARHGVTEGAVRTALSSIREALRLEVRAELAELTTDAAELEEEWNVLFGR